MVDPVIHAEMTILVRREKELNEQVADLESKELPLWAKRVQLAENKGMADLADEARGRLRELQAQLTSAKGELDSIEMQKSMLRHQARRPSGVEVARAEHLVEQARLAGLVDPDRADWDELERRARAKSASSGSEGDVFFDFDED